uniref:nucleoside-diphosphate kinase n=1 Tax=Globodera pallida TaxID=36090 RepID=A0A183BHS7_GLOPA
MSSDKNRERTFIAIKPDGVQRGLVAKIIKQFEQRGYKLVALKLVKSSIQHLEVHYQDLKDKAFFPGLVQYMASGPIVAMVWEGLDVVKQGRVILGATNPLASAPGTIRGNFCIETGRNICHGSDSASLFGIARDCPLVQAGRTRGMGQCSKHVALRMREGGKEKGIAA